MAKYAGFGLQLEWDPAGGTTWVVIAQIGDFSGPGLTRNVLNAPAHDDTDKWIDKIKSFKDGGQITFPIFYDPAGATHDASTGLLSDLSEETAVPNWRITFPDTGSTVWTSLGILSSFEPQGPVEGMLTANVTIDLTGAPTLA